MKAQPALDAHWATAAIHSTPREVATREFDGYWVYLESPPTEAGERRLLDR
jgi:hypothetical protein